MDTTNCCAVRAEDTVTRAYIVERRSGWFAVSKWTGVDDAEGTTVVGPMSRKDAVLVRDSMKRQESQS